MEGHNRDESFVGLDKLKKQHAQQVAKFQEWADGGQWGKFHREHFDWWTFPVELPSTNYGPAYAIGRADAADLLADPSFLPLYRKGRLLKYTRACPQAGGADELCAAPAKRTGVELIARSWGWDIGAQQCVEKPGTHLQHVIIA
jgi:hypothetical protein